MWMSIQKTYYKCGFMFCRVGLGLKRWTKYEHLTWLWHFSYVHVPTTNMDQAGFMTYAADDALASVLGGAAVSIMFIYRLCGLDSRPQVFSQFCIFDITLIDFFFLLSLRIFFTCLASSLPSCLNVNTISDPCKLFTALSLKRCTETN